MTNMTGDPSRCHDCGVALLEHESVYCRDCANANFGDEDEDGECDECGRHRPTVWFGSAYGYICDDCEPGCSECQSRGAECTRHGDPELLAAERAKAGEG